MQRIFFCLFYLFSFPAFSQEADSVLALPEEKRSLALYELYANSMSGEINREAVLLRFDSLYKDFEARKETRLSRIAWSLEFLYRVYHTRHANAVEIEAYIEQAILEAREKGWHDIELEAKFSLGVIKFRDRDYGEGMELMLENYSALEKLGWSDRFVALACHYQLGNAFYEFGDMENAIRYNLAAMRYQLPQTSPAFEFQTLNTIGLSYDRLGKYDSAVYFIKQSHDLAALRRDSVWYFLTIGNLGNIYFKMGDMVKAKPNLEADYYGSIRAGSYGSAVNAGSLLARIELAEGNIPKAEEYLRFSRMYMDTSDLRGMITYATNLYTYHKMKGDYKRAVAYADTLQSYTARKEKVFDKNILDQAEIRVQMARYESDVNLLKAARSRQVVMRNGLLVILLLSGLVVILWIKRMMLKRQTDQEKLALAEAELKRYTNSLLEKNELIQTFRDELDKIRTEDNLQLQDRSATISTLMHANILTDDDWREFRRLFDVVYPGFLVRLKEKINDLTPAETRILALTKLQLPGKDMADMLGISPDSIKKTRYRLRKKINLPEEGTLEELVSMI